MNSGRVNGFCILALLGCVSALAEDPEPRSTRYVIEVFTMPTAAAYDLIALDAKGSEMHAKVMEAVKAKTATLDKLMVSKTHSRGLIQQVEDYLYPTEFDPPQVPQTLAIVDPGPKAERPAKTPAPGSVVSPFNGGIGTMTTTTPTAFQTRPLGDKWEISSASINENGTASVTYALETNELTSVAHVGDLPCPIFAKKTLKGSAKWTPGQPTFLGTYNYARRSGVPHEHGEDSTSLAFMTAQPDAIPKAPAKDSVRDNRDSMPVRLTLEVVSLDKAVAHPLIMASLDDTVLHERITALIGLQQAKRETTLVTRSRSGLRSKIENADEFIQPTEFDPPQLAGGLILANRQLLQDLRAGRQTGLGEQPPVPGGNPNGGFGLLTTLSPTAFQTMNLGESLEFDPYISGNVADINLSAAITRLVGTVPYNGIDHPVYGRQSMDASVRCQLDHPILLGTLNKAVNTGFTDSNKEDRIWLAFLRVSTH